MRSWSICLLALAAACMPQAAPIPFTQTDSADYDGFAGTGQLSLRGQAFLTTRSGRPALRGSAEDHDGGRGGAVQVLEGGGGDLPDTVDGDLAVPRGLAETRATPFSATIGRECSAPLRSPGTGTDPSR